MWIDTHAHLTAEAFDADRPAVLERARLAGVGQVICIGDDAASSRAGVELAEASSGVYAAVGIHPHSADEADDEALAVIERLAGEGKVAAIGETGLDYHYDHAPRAAQQAAFRRHIRLARRVGLPLVVHNRKADKDVLRLLEEEGAAEVGGVLHCFWSGAETALRALELGFFLGVGGPVTFKSADELRAVLRALPADRLLVETDAPYLAPVPYRGRRNEPAYAAEAGRALAELLGMPEEELAAQTTANARRLFSRLGSDTL